MLPDLFRRSNAVIPLETIQFAELFHIPFDSGYCDRFIRNDKADDKGASPVLHFTIETTVKM